jgi:D-threo-aldose 1-dehydrogenase
MSDISFPATDELCSRLAFGTGRLGRGDLANVEATIRTAYDLGIRHFDSSVGYDNSVPHAALARLLRDVPRDDVFISTKIGHFRPSFPGYRDLYRNADVLWGVVHECYRMLLGRIDLLQIHEADLRFWWDPDAPDSNPCYLEPGTEYDVAGSAVSSVIARAKSEGVCRYTGATGNSSGPLARAVANLDVDTVMCAYNLDPIFRGALRSVAPVARDRDLLFMAAGVLQGGAYRDPLNPPERLTRSPQARDAFSRFHRIQEQAGLSAVELLLRWSLSVDGVDRWILGASRPEQVEQTMGMLRKGPLPEDLTRALNELALPDEDGRP